jgi:hypothetical protein
MNETEIRICEGNESGEQNINCRSYQYNNIMRNDEHRENYNITRYGKY